LETIITIRDGKLTAGERTRLRALGERLKRYFRALIAIEWDFYTTSLDSVAICRVKSRTGNYRARAEGKRYGVAMDAAFDKVVRQRLRQREKMLAKRRITSIHSSG